MRLLRLEDSGELSLTEFIGNDIPCYAVLSHTWGRDRDEVTLKDIADGTYQSKPGYRKIQSCGKQAAKDGFQYFWVDTCCIDKSSSAELTESINSMFSLYTTAMVCYVYLADLQPQTLAQTALSHCRWFTRGWTLQELLAPKVVKFYDLGWNLIGTRLDLAEPISSSTGIPAHFLLEHMALSDASVAMRMSWAAHRRTTRIENLAYCLLGIFQVNMPLIYGEGIRAFRRLQEEIVKRNNDLTIFAWEDTDGPEQQFVGLFAPSPAAFSGSSGIVPFADDFANFTVTNRGLYLTGDIPLRVVEVASKGGHRETLYVIFLGTNLDLSSLEEVFSRSDGGVYLRKIGPRLFCRQGLLGLAGFRDGVEQVGIYEVNESYILLDPTTDVADACSSFRSRAIHVPFHKRVQLETIVPESLWDHTDRIFLRPKRYHWTTYPTVLAMKFSINFGDDSISLVVLCDYRGQNPTLRICTAVEYRQETMIIFQQRHREDGISWEELEMQAPRVHAMNQFAAVRAGDRIHQISVNLRRGTVGHMSGDTEVLVLNLLLDGVPASLENST